MKMLIFIGEHTYIISSRAGVVVFSSGRTFAL